MQTLALCLALIPAHQYAANPLLHRTATNCIRNPALPALYFFPKVSDLNVIQEESI
jgi:hypothetical protein